MTGLTKLVLLVCAAMVVAGSAVAETVSIGDKLPDIVAAAKREGSINIVWSTSGYGDEQVAREEVANMNKMFGLDLTFRFAPGDSMPEQGNKLFTEYKAGQPSSSDLFISAPLALTELLSAGIFAEVPWTTLSEGRIAPAMVEGAGHVLRLTTGITEVTYSTDLMPHPPDSLAGLLAPDWTGKIATTPYAAGFDVLLASDFWGVAKTMDFAKQFLPQVAGLIRCGEEQRIANGEFAALAMDCTSQGPDMWMARGAPINYFIPKDAAQLRYYYYAIPKNAAHPNAAALMGLYLMSADGQATLWKLLRQDLDNFPDSNNGKIVKQYEAKGVTFKPITADWWVLHPEIGQNMKPLLSLFTASK
jgi:iron(III) transport system substrate-binding protein